MNINKVKINNTIYDTWSTKDDIIECNSELTSRINGMLSSQFNNTNSTLSGEISKLQGNNPDATNSKILEELGGVFTSLGEIIDAISNIRATSEKVLLPNIRITNAQIVDGYWAAELVDSSKMTALTNTFSNCNNLRYLDVSKWDVSNVTNMTSTFGFCSSLQKVDVSKWDVSNVTIMTATFSYCLSLEELDLSNWDVSNVTNIGNMFFRCSMLKQLDLSNWIVNNVTDATSAFNYCSALESLVGGKSISDVISNNICVLSGLKVPLSLSDTVLDRASLRAVINGLADLTGQSPQTLTLGSTLSAKLTNGDIAIATTKNWTIA